MTKMACIGYASAFFHVGDEFMLDVHGNKLYVNSKDRRFFAFGGIGVSKFYPMAFGNHVILNVTGQMTAILML